MSYVFYIQSIPFSIVHTDIAGQKTALIQTRQSNKAAAV